MNEKIDILIMSLDEKITYLEYAKQRVLCNSIDGYLCDTMLTYRFQIAKNYCNSRELLKKNFEFINIDTSNNRGGWFKSKDERLKWIDEQFNLLIFKKRWPN